MSLANHLARHLALSEELHRLCLEENRILKHEGRPPDEAWRERKRATAARLDESLSALRARPVDAHERGGELLQRTRERHLQILHLDRENEQLLLRCSLGPARPAPSAFVSAAGAARAYARPS